MAVAALSVVLIVLLFLAVGGPLFLCGAVSSEAESRSTIDRREAEQRVRQRPSRRNERE